MNHPALQGIAALQSACHQAAAQRGWWSDYHEMPEKFRKYYIGTKITLIHSEISEVMEGQRCNKMDDHISHRPAVEVEIADAIIRMLDMAGALGLDVEGAIVDKMAYNAKRADHDVANREAAGGKSF